MFENFQLTESAPISFTSLFINLAVGALISIILKFHYKKYGSTISNREEFSNIFPFILLTTTLVITIVKSSLALSLGLVGALSIVRFRAAIKEPEELVYLFLIIAIGLANGANQFMVSIIATFTIVIMCYFFSNSLFICMLNVFSVFFRLRIVISLPRVWYNKHSEVVRYHFTILSSSLAVACFLFIICSKNSYVAFSHLASRRSRRSSYRRICYFSWNTFKVRWIWLYKI